VSDVTVGLAPLDSTDMALVRSWRNDYRIWKWCRQNDLISDVEQADWFRRQALDPAVKMWKLVAAVGGVEPKPVGVAGLTSICRVNGRAEFSCYVAPDVQGKGVGSAALRVLFDHGFDNLGLNLIWGETFDGNPAARLFERIGMVREGTRRSFYWRDGRWVDAHLFSVTREEWNARRSADSRDRPASAVAVPGVGRPQGATGRRRSLGAAGRLGKVPDVRAPGAAAAAATDVDV
jgi:RimJ/RimL family protein N-acetyltransferase